MIWSMIAAAITPATIFGFAASAGVSESTISNIVKGGLNSTRSGSCGFAYFCATVLGFAAFGVFAFTGFGCAAFNFSAACLARRISRRLLMLTSCSPSIPYILYTGVLILTVVKVWERGYITSLYGSQRFCA